MTSIVVVHAWYTDPRVWFGALFLAAHGAVLGMTLASRRGRRRRWGALAGAAAPVAALAGWAAIWHPGWIYI